LPERTKWKQFVELYFDWVIGKKKRSFDAFLEWGAEKNWKGVNIPTADPLLRSDYESWNRDLEHEKLEKRVRDLEAIAYWNALDDW
jgi:hypothetical protein